MRDFNFFSPYIVAKKEKTDKGRLFILAMAILLAGIIFLVSFFQVLQFMNLKATKDELVAIMEAEDYKQRVEEAQTKMKSVNELEDEKLFFSELQVSMAKIHKVNEDIMKFIEKEMINDLFLMELYIEGSTVEIVGRSLNKNVIAQFENDLRETEKFESIRISEIKDPFEEDNEKYYDFTIKLIAKR